MIQENRRIKQRDIALKIGFSQEKRGPYHWNIKLQKICASWVPRQLTAPMNEHRKTVAQELLNQYLLEGDLLKNIAPGCESWFHHYDLEKKGNPRNIIIQVLRV